MILGMNKTDQGNFFIYEVLKDCSIKNSKTGFIENLRPNETITIKQDLRGDPNLKFLSTIRYAFIPPEMVEINEILSKYPIVKTHLRSHIIDRITFKEVIKEIKVTYIPIYTPIKNWISNSKIIEFFKFNKKENNTYKSSEISDEEFTDLIYNNSYKHNLD